MSTDDFEEEELSPEIAEESSGWQPPPDVKQHNGSPIPRDADFFVEPPSEIGEIVTAQTTLNVAKQPFATGPRLLMVMGLSGAVLFGAMTAAKALIINPNEAQTMGYVFGGGGALITALLVYYFTRFSHTATYVGKLGVVRYTLSGSRDNTPKAEQLLFADCEDVTTWSQRNYTNGIYTGTHYKHAWRNAEGRELYALKGSYNSEKGTPKATSPFWFAASAEGYWNEFAFDRMTQQFEKDGHIEFRVHRKDNVRVGPGFLEFTFGGKTTRLTTDDIKTLSINNGTFAIHTHEARWFSSKGKFSFEYGGMGNAKLFLFALERLAGYTFGD